jgi:hypothetical protein
MAEGEDIDLVEDIIIMPFSRQTFQEKLGATITYLKLHDQFKFTDHEKHAVTCFISLMIELNVHTYFAWNNQKCVVLTLQDQGYYNQMVNIYLTIP